MILLVYRGILSSGMGWWFSILSLCNIKEARWCMEMVLMFVKVSNNVDLLIFSVFFRISIDGMWMEHLAPAIKTMSGETFHPA